MTTITDEPDSGPGRRSLAQRIGFWVGPALFALIAFSAPPQGLPVEAMRMAGLAVWVAVWWATEAIPIAATSLLPLVVIPLAGAGNEKLAAAPYAIRLSCFFWADRSRRSRSNAGICTAALR